MVWNFRHYKDKIIIYWIKNHSLSSPWAPPDICIALVVWMDRVRIWRNAIFDVFFARFPLVKIFRQSPQLQLTLRIQWKCSIKCNPNWAKSCPKSTFVQCWCCQLSVSLASIMEENASGSSELSRCRAMLSVWKLLHYNFWIWKFHI